MSTTDGDTKSSAPDEGAESKSGSTGSEREILISEKDLNDLAGLLSTFRDMILAHELRLTALEARETAPEVAKPTLIKPGD